MKIAFATAQSLRGSTNVGRILPLAHELTQHGHQCHILALTTASAAPPTTPCPVHFVGTEPFRRTSEGKKRLRGLGLLGNMVATAVRTAQTLRAIQPDVVIISKPLPANVTGVWLYSLVSKKTKIVLDTDDFELTANKLSSIYQRAVIHWSERKAAQLATSIIAASPFLADHFKQLTQNSKQVEVIATGLGIAGPAFAEASAGKPALGPRLPREAEGEVGKRHPLITLAYLGSVSVSSGHRVDLLPEILEILVTHFPQLQLLIAGDGDDVAKLKEELKQRKLNQHVAWHGRFKGEEVGQLLTPDTILLDPIDDSIANRAKSSFRVMLAGLVGLPLVTSNIGIRAELLPTTLHDRTFAEPGDATSYAEKIAAWVTGPLSAQEKYELREHTRQYTWETLGKKYETIITST